MKRISKTAVFALIIGVLFHLSCKKSDQIIPNKAPAARAGADLAITLPVDSVTLNGTASSDPDGSISSYLWTKISGPKSFNITDSSNARTVVKNLAAGAYQFELKVTDRTNFSAKDTVLVTVNLEGGCPQSVQFILHKAMPACSHSESFSKPGWVHLTATVSNKIFFGVTDGYHGEWNMYDTSARTWSTLPGNLEIGGPVVGNKIVSPRFKNGWAQSVDIYDAFSNSSSTAQFQESVGYSPLNAVVGSKVFFAAGHHVDSNWTWVSKKINVYDTASNSCTVINFNEARGGMAAVSFGNKIFFAGGWYRNFDLPVLYCDDDGTNCHYEPAIVGSNRVDIYDVSSGTWSSTQLSEARGDITTAIVDNKILFAGGGSSKRVDIYDASSNSWSTGQLSNPLNDPGLRKRAHSVGHKVLITGFWSNIVDIYDATTNSWTTKQMGDPNGTTDYLVASAGNKILFFKVFDKEGYEMHLDIYDASTNKWSTAELNRGLARSGIIAVGNQIYIAGGIIGSIGNFGDNFLDDVWLFKF
jgi:hypothetical protein